MQAAAELPYDFNRPWPFWFFIGKIVSKAFFGNEEQLEWLNSVLVRNREYIAFTNTRKNSSDLEDQSTGNRRLRVVEADFLKPQPRENLKLFWKPARGIICQKMQDCKSMIFVPFPVYVRSFFHFQFVIFFNRVRLCVKWGLTLGDFPSSEWLSGQPS